LKKTLKFLGHVPKHKVKEKIMSLIVFLLGMMVGSVVGVTVLCLMSFVREPKLPADLPKSWKVKSSLAEAMPGMKTAR
jgi:predicted lysophospholipase L1 biosynthesis ABC-type transport system permease subunit